MSQLNELSLHFVLPEEDANAECSKDMYECFELTKRLGGKPKWTLPSESMKERPKANDVFVFDEFTGPAFMKLKEDKSKYMLLGAKCLLTCLTSGRPIPPGDAPVFTEGMRGQVVCCSGFDADTKRYIQERVEYMGGTFSPSLRSITTHVVALNNLSLKAIEAYNVKKPIMKLEWIEAVWLRSLVCDVRGCDEEFDCYLSPLFHNLKFCSSGLSKRRKEDLKRTILQYGGAFMGQLEMNLTNILLIEHPEGEKFDAAIGWKIPCVKTDWITKCVESNRIVPQTKYLVKKKAISSTPTGEGTVDFTGNFSAVSIINRDMGNVTRLEETEYLTGTQPFSTPFYESDSINFKINEIIECNRNAGHYLDGYNIYLSGFTPAQSEKLRKILNQAGATRFDKLTKSVTHVIVPRLNLENVKETTAHVLPLDWLYSSAVMSKPAPIGGFIKAVKPSQVAPPSPLSQQSALLLSRPVPRNLEEDFNRPEAIEVEQPADDDDLANRYRLSQPGESISRQEPSLVLTPSARPGETEWESNSFLRGFTIYVSSKLETEEINQLKSLITGHKGKCSLKQGSIVADFAVVPLSGDSLPEVVARDVVNILYIRDCAQSLKILPIEYQHLPVSMVKGVTPLKGCVVCVSKYIGSQRDFVEMLSRELGARVQPVLAKKLKGGIFQTTHLICSDPVGMKYEGAVRWGLPVVHHTWLLKCAEMGTKVPEEKYSLKGLQPKSSSNSMHQLSSRPETSISNLWTSPPPKEHPIDALISPKVVKESLERAKSTIIQSQAPNPTIERLKNSGTPQSSPGPDNNTMSPYGACFGVNTPSPDTRKRLSDWIEQGPSFELDPPKKRFVYSARRSNQSFSFFISEQLRLMTRKPEDQPPDDSPVAVAKRREEYSSALIPEYDIINGLEKMREIEASYSKTTNATPSTSVDAEPSKMVLVTESQHHTEVGWEDPSDRDVALANLENEAERVQPKEKIFMLTGLGEAVEGARALIEACNGRVSQLPHYDKSATHLIAGKSMTRGEKLLGSLAAGLWILHPSYLTQLKVCRDVNAITETDYLWGAPQFRELRSELPSFIAQGIEKVFLQTDNPRCFSGMRFIFNVVAPKSDVFSRIVEAGGGEIITADSIVPHGSCYCVYESPNAPDAEESNYFARRNVCCVTPLLINDLVLRRFESLSDYMVPGFEKFWSSVSNRRK